jgi:MarR family transcriptional regulator, organic hydroperoxide resistance regulator
MQLFNKEQLVAASASPDREHLIAELRRLQVAIRPAQMRGAAPLMDLELTIPQLRVVFLLADSESLSMSPMAQELGITLPACSHVVDRLVRSGFVVRSEDPEDRRVVRCSLTDKGKSVAERIRQSSPFERQEFLSLLTVDELKVIVQAMAVFHRVMLELGAEPIQAPPGDTPGAPSID